jgi:hypothetical protein
MAITVSANGAIELDEETRQSAGAFFDALEAVNLDEVTIETVRVGVRDYRLVPEVDECGNIVIENGQKKLRREFYTRIAEIQNFVPMLVLNQMMATRKKMLRLRQEYLGSSQEDGADPMMDWMLAQVLAVWKVSEPDMTLDRLGFILPFDKASRLFTLFFGHLFLPSRI